MSDLSDDLHEAMQSMKEESDYEQIDEFAKVHAVTKDSIIHQLPSYHAMLNYYHKQIQIAVRKMYRYNAGSAKFDGTRDAFDKTRVLMEKYMIPVLILVLADGIQIGHGVSNPVKKSRFFDKMDEIFTQDSFRADSDMLAITINSDYDSMAWLNEQVFGTAEYLAHATGFSRANEEAAQTKIWDLWALSALSAISAFYGIGHKVGEVWKERDTLKGIELASEDVEEQS